METVSIDCQTYKVSTLNGKEKALVLRDGEWYTTINYSVFEVRQAIRDAKLKAIRDEEKRREREKAKLRAKQERDLKRREEMYEDGR